MLHALGLGLRVEQAELTICMDYGFMERNNTHTQLAECECQQIVKMKTKVVLLKKKCSIV